ncbi:MAG: ATP phosphoribosyltransferase [Patescibacteria group bacterium]|nr:ATP phosphoribosyltransferase [Patescibacteria group bacterium]
MSEFETKLKIAIQKTDGRMGQDSTALLSAANFSFQIGGRVDICEVEDFPLSIELVRIGDIPNDVERGYADFGIVGQNSLAEAESAVIPLMPLGFGKCRLQLGVKKDVPYEKPSDLNGLTVATSYPNLSRDFFAKSNTNVDLLVRSGSIEKYVKSGEAQACVDISSSGDSMRANGITAYDVLLESEAMLVASPKLREKRGSERFVKEFLMGIESALRVRNFTYIVMNAPESARQTITDLLPSGESPTMSPLNESGWWAISSLIPRRNFRMIISELQEAGAKDILELSPKQIIPNRNDRAIIDLMEKIYG